MYQSHAFRLALAFDFQLLETVPTEIHDVPMDGILTENGIYFCGRFTNMKKWTDRRYYCYWTACNSNFTIPVNPDIIRCVFTVNNAISGADAIVVLSGGKATRIPHALKLFAQGYAPRLLLTDEKKEIFVLHICFQQMKKLRRL